MPIRTAASSRGFTLLETVFAMTLGAIVLAAALPAYQDQLRRSRRADAMRALNDILLAQERWRAEHPSYSPDLASLGLAAASPAGHYRIAMTGSGDSGYTVTAQATSPSQAADLACRELRLTLAGGQLVQASADARGAVDASNAQRCWLL